MKKYYPARTRLSMKALSSLICQVLMNFEKDQRLTRIMIRLCMAVLLSCVVLCENRAAAQCCPPGTLGMVETTTPLTPAVNGVENNDGGRDWDGSPTTTGTTEFFNIVAVFNMETVTWTIPAFTLPAGARLCSVTDPTVAVTSNSAVLTISSTGTSVTGTYSTGYTISANPAGALIALGSGTLTVTVTAGSVVTQTGCPLPVELMDFSGQQDGRCATLNWSTYSERDNDYFTIQKLIGEEFVDIGKVESHFGTTTQQSDYEFTDCDVSAMNYYRLVQTDRNGFYEIIGEITSVPMDMEDPGQLLLVPNPSDDFTCIYSDENLLRMRIVSPEGKIVRQEELAGDARQYCFSVDAMIAGVYTVQVETTKGMVSKKLVVI